MNTQDFIKQPDNPFWKGLSNLIYFFGILNLVMMLVVFSEQKAWIDSPYWSLGGTIVLLQLIVTMTLMIAGAVIRKLPTHKTFK